MRPERIIYSLLSSIERYIDDETSVRVYPVVLPARVDIPALAFRLRDIVNTDSFENKGSGVGRRWEIFAYDSVWDGVIDAEKDILKALKSRISRVESVVDDSTNIGEQTIYIRIITVFMI